MAAENIKPTRSELMKLKTRIKLAKSGYNLLKKKRDGLILEFFEILKQAKTLRQELTEEYKEALGKINVARTVEGDMVLTSLSLAVKNAPEITLQQKNIMGVVVPKIGHEKQEQGFDRGYGTIASSALIDESTDAFQEVVEKVIKAAEVETAIKKLLQEIEKTKRRVNALEFEVIPRMEEQRKFIQMRLDEMERESVFRLKRIKK
ncbi:V-type ATP synthase subunit D [Candidatus Woesearchaeota archaeon CG10_big_fil_rev_8_21_14_0_10_34_8]|nr:MAG: V-type ATP synthase subunit D [Candidatus Woesearchaeota archaeon CG10_big_fil_rev_8_21_14_0_10_34_8]